MRPPVTLLPILACHNVGLGLRVLVCTHWGTGTGVWLCCCAAMLVSIVEMYFLRSKSAVTEGRSLSFVLVFIGHSKTKRWVMIGYRQGSFVLVFIGHSKTKSWVMIGYRQWGY